jgi:hypothetical protein
MPVIIQEKIYSGSPVGRPLSGFLPVIMPTPLGAFLNPHHKASQLLFLDYALNTKFPSGV